MDVFPHHMPCSDWSGPRACPVLIGQSRCMPCSDWSDPCMPCSDWSDSCMPCFDWSDSCMPCSDWSESCMPCSNWSGDGAGVGQGDATVAGIIYENFLLGRERALWYVPLPFSLLPLTSIMLQRVVSRSKLNTMLET